MDAAAFGLSLVAVGIAVIALALALLMIRQSGQTLADLRAHRRAHLEAHGHADPKLDRRQTVIGPPRGTGERRGATRYATPPERLAPPDPADLDRLTPDPVDLRRTRHAAPDAEPPTGELGPPTAIAPAVRPAPPPRPQP